MVNRIIRNGITAAACILTLAGSVLAADFEKIHFTDDGTATGTPLAPGFTMNSCWGALGYHYNGNVYVAISNHTTNNGNVALFRYDTDAGTMHYLSTVKDISTAAGNWDADDTHYKIHSQLPQHADGTIYMTTQEDANPLFPGAKMYTVGPDAVDEVVDYTASSSWYLDKDMVTHSGNIGHLAENYGVITLGVNPRVPDITYGITYPDGYLFIHNPQTGHIKKVAKTISGSSDYISRYIGVDNDGNAYIAKNLGDQTEQMYKFRRSDSTWYAIGDPFPETGSYSYWGGFVAQVATASGDTLYGQTFNGQVIRVVYATESVEIVGTNMPGAGAADHNLAISADGNHLYSLHIGWMPPTYSTAGVRFYDYDLRTATYDRGDFIPLYESYAYLKGMHIADAHGNMYIVGWNNSGPGFDNIALFKINPGAGMMAPNPPLSVWGKSSITDGATGSGMTDAITDAGVWPSPFRHEVAIGFRTAASARVSLYDARGRFITDLPVPADMPGYKSVVWDGNDRAGRTVPAGIYFYEVNAGGSKHRGRIIKAE